MRRIRRFGLGLALAGALVARVAQADQAQDMADLQHFMLTEDYLAKYEAVQDDAAADPCNLSPLMLLKGDGGSIDEMAKAYDAQPGVHAMLARHGLTARENILGTMTLMLAAFQELKETHPDMVTSKGPTPTINAANMAFYKSHKAALHEHAMALGKKQLEANHGKLPACLSSGG